MKILITGANGYLGRHLMVALQKEHDAFGLKFALGDPISAASLENFDALIHTAYDFSLTKPEEIVRVNQHGSITLLKAAIDAGIKKMIFISSLSASRQSQSQYGKVKYEIEQFALQHNIDVIRPGLIYSHDAKGLMGAMQGIIKKLPIVPLIGNGNQPFHVCQIDCLMQLIQKILKHPQPICYPIAAGHPTPKTFKEILKSLAQASHKSPLFIPIPWTMVYYGLKIAELLHIPVGFRSDSLLSLKTVYDDNHFELPPELQIEWQQIESF